MDGHSVNQTRLQLAFLKLEQLQVDGVFVRNLCEEDAAPCAWLNSVEYASHRAGERHTRLAKGQVPEGSFVPRVQPITGPSFRLLEGTADSVSNAQSDLRGLAKRSKRNKSRAAGDVIRLE